MNKIRQTLPAVSIKRYFEPFLGGGAVLLSVDPEIPAHVSDTCGELVNLYRGGASGDPELRVALGSLANIWAEFDQLEQDLVHLALSLAQGRLSDVACADALLALSAPALDSSPSLISEHQRRLLRDAPKKLERVRRLQIERQKTLAIEDLAANLESIVRAAFYMAVRARYNQARVSLQSSPVRDADFFFLREFAYAAMFRFNAKGEFNVPYGGISYHRKSFQAKIDYLFSAELRPRLMNTNFYRSDFQAFLEKFDINGSDFIFVDPPYDSEFSDYDEDIFGDADHRRLANVLGQLDAKVMLVIGDTPLIRSLYPSSIWNITEEPMTYAWTIKARNDRQTRHLTITNY